MKSTEATTGVALPVAHYHPYLTPVLPGVFVSIQEVKPLTDGQRQFHTALLTVQIVIAIVMLGLALDWALGDGTQRAWLAFLGIVLTALQLLDRRNCE